MLQAVSAPSRGSGNAGRIVFKTNPIELDPAHIARIDQAIKGY